MKILKSIVMLAVATLLAMPMQAQKDEKAVYQITDDVEVPHTIVQNQASSGTCWCFAGTGFVEAEILRKYDVKLNLSEMYFVRWAYAKKFDRFVQMHGVTNLSCGGEVIDVLYALTDAGMITDEAYPGFMEGFTRHNHGELQKAIEGYAKTVTQKSSGRILYETYPKALKGILDAYLGEVPEEFENNGAKYNPKSFAEKYALDLNEYVQFASFTDKEMYKPFNIMIPDNWTNTPSYNMPFDEMMAELDNALNNGYTVGWAQDVSDKGFSRKAGVAIVPTDDVNAIRESNPKAFKKMTDAEVLEKQYSFEYVMPEKEVTEEMHQIAYNDWSTGDDHSMLIVGIAHDQNGTKYYKVKNSWGETGPYAGYWYCSEQFVKLHTVFFTVNKAAFSDTMKDKLF
ncbi:MAG: C1 family peptidase [Bacteroidales bacterium]|nr:C1 family peptidase [Bacteroidales bacterium]